MMSLCDDIISGISQKFVTFWYQSHFVTGVTNAPVSLSVTPPVYLLYSGFLAPKKGGIPPKYCAIYSMDIIHRNGHQPMDISIVVGLAFNGYIHCKWSKGYSYR
jgi:hypothetical protein